MSDESGEAEVKLWGDRLMHVQPAKGTQITLTWLFEQDEREQQDVNNCRGQEIVGYTWNITIVYSLSIP